MAEEREGIRQWYERTTRVWRKSLVWATVIALIGAAIFYCLGSNGAFTKIQTFNGALTIPVGAALWMASFVFIFLIPSREAGFRSQEWIEMMADTLNRTIQEEIQPGIKIWIRIGERIEKEIPDVIREFKEGLQTVKSSALRVEEVVRNNEKVAEDIKPVIEALKRLESRIDKEIQSGLLEEVRQAARSVKAFAGTPVPPKKNDIQHALGVLAAGGKK